VADLADAAAATAAASDRAHATSKVQTADEHSGHIELCEDVEQENIGMEVHEAAAAHAADAGHALDIDIPHDESSFESSLTGPPQNAGAAQDSNQQLQDMKLIVRVTMVARALSSFQFFLLYLRYLPLSAHSASRSSLRYHIFCALLSATCLFPPRQTETF
jgi:hypothetical protein